MNETIIRRHNEMVKVLQNYRSEKDNHPEYSVTKHKPLHYSKEPLIEVMSLQNEMKQAKRHAITKGKDRKNKQVKNTEEAITGQIIRYEKQGVTL